MNNWKPIDSVPREEKTYLVFSPTYGYQVDAYNSINSGIPRHPRFAIPDITHYMDLPQPPETKE